MSIVNCWHKMPCGLGQFRCGYLRIILSYTDAYTDAARTATKPKLKIGWTPTNEDTSHVSLSSSGGRNYVSNGYGMQRTDWAA